MSKIKALINPVTPFAQNAPNIYCENTKQCAFVDPGGDIEMLVQIAHENELIPAKILLTHGHADHAGGATELSNTLDIAIIGPHEEDLFLLQSLEEQGRMFGMEANDCMPQQWLKDGDEVILGEALLSVFHCPGHTPGHIIFFNSDSKLAIVGDVLFRGSIGRTDLPKGNHADLLASIQTKLWPLGDDVIFISGHGPVSTFGQERLDNAFVADSVLQD